MRNSKYGIESLMQRFVENEIKNKISSKTPRADLIKCLLKQEFGLKDDSFLIYPNDYENEQKAMYGHITTEFSIRLENCVFGVVVAEDNSGFIKLKTKFKRSDKAVNQEALVVKKLIVFFNNITGKNKLIDFKVIPKEFYKHYVDNNIYTFSEEHLWEGDTETAKEIVKDLYCGKFNSFCASNKPYLNYCEAKYNDAYNSAEIKLLVWDYMRKTACKSESLSK